MNVGAPVKSTVSKLRVTAKRDGHLEKVSITANSYGFWLEAFTLNQDDREETIICIIALLFYEATLYHGYRYVFLRLSYRIISLQPCRFPNGVPPAFVARASHHAGTACLFHKNRRLQRSSPLHP